MINKKSIWVVVLAIAGLAATLFAMTPSRSAIPVREYDPWTDLNNDGEVNVLDLSLVALKFGTGGPPIAKASILYDSGWLNITEKCGQNITLTHNLNSIDIIVDITGKTTIDGGVHQKHLGLTEHTLGWKRTYGGVSLDEGRSVVRSSDGGYAIAGPVGEDFGLVKTDACGQMEWNKTYGGTGTQAAYCVIQTSDGGYAMSGFTNSFGAGLTDGWLVKTDMQGNMEWNKTYGGTSFDAFDGHALIQTRDGGYAICGGTYSFAREDCDAWLVKTDGNGNIQWNKSYPNGRLEAAKNVIQTSDGGYALACVTGQSPIYDFWLVKTDANGNAMWNKTYGGPYYEVPWEVIQTSDGGYALASGTSVVYDDRPHDFWLVKADANGTQQWNKTYGGAGLEDACSVFQTVDGGYALAGYTTSFGAGGRDFWLVKVDVYGNMQWNKTYGGTGDDGFDGTSAIKTGDGGYALVGRTDSFGAGSGDFWLVKTDVESGLGWTDSTLSTITLRRGETDPYWNFVRVRIWKVK